ncbi:putative MAPEG superfamily protein [Sphingomonas vulcanisoli]|uniref:MAPEG superfamily protein n=1 Tax=Sphingomonas vulcanisoli TaxID=1658060 RepID=A0ABX0TV94_9SPHN|nr:MAPEG family protein [Sphingomonas vulcanisoli]NIJ08307.1 putative MAPEG superfamily protein [Sphingomonas vulcanisoli]
MANPLLWLGLTLVLALVQIFLAGHFRTKQYGTDWNVGARDKEMPPLDPLAGRLVRAQANLFETLPLYIGGLLGAVAAGHLGWKTNIGAPLYFFARLIYVPLYAAGIPYIRSLVWLAGTAGLLLILWALIAG